MLTHLYLIRHGEAVCNVDRAAPTAGMKGDLGLTELGKLQAERLRDRLAATGEIQPDVFIASTLPRARQTAEIIAPAIGLPIIWDDEVQELRVGEIDGVPWRDIAESVPDFRIEPFRPLAPGGENWPQFMLRVATALDRITREHEGKTIVVVCHGGVIDSSFAIFYGAGAFSFPAVDLATRNTSITHWQRLGVDNLPRHWERPAPDGLPACWRLLGYNDDAHVRDIGAEERIRWPRANASATGGAEAPAVPLPTEPNDGLPS